MSRPANAKIKLTTDSKDLERGLVAARKRLRGFAGNARKDLHKSRALSSVMRGAHYALGAAGFSSIAGFAANTFRGIADFEREMTRFQIDAQLSDKEVAAFREQVMATSNATGQARLAILQGAHAYQILTGDAHGAVEAAKLFAEVANASGASMNDIAATAASMRKNLGIDPKDFRAGFDVLLKMGHEGSVELRDLAAEMSGLAPQFKDFGNSLPQEKLAELVATAQGMRNNFKDASTMADGFRQLMTQVVKQHAKLEAHGIQVFRTDAHGHIAGQRDFMEIVHDILSNKNLSNAKGMMDIFGRQEAVRALEAMRDHWADIVRLKDESLNSDQVAKDNTTWMNSTSGKLAVAWEHLRNAIADAASPERIDAWVAGMSTILDLTSKIVDGWSQLFTFAKWFSSGETGDKKLDVDSYANNLASQSTKTPAQVRYLGGRWRTAKTQADVQRMTIDEAKEIYRSGDDVQRAGAKKYLETAAGFAFSNAGDLLWQVHANPHDPWAAQRTYGPELPASVATSRAMADGSLEKAVKNGMRAALSEIGIVVKMDDSTVAKKVENAHHQRAPRGR